MFLLAELSRSLTPRAQVLRGGKLTSLSHISLLEKRVSVGGRNPLSGAGRGPFSFSQLLLQCVLLIHGFAFSGFLQLLLVNITQKFPEIIHKFKTFPPVFHFYFTCMDALLACLSVVHMHAAPTGFRGGR